MNARDSALDAFVRAYWRELHGYLSVIIRDVVMAEDLAQEVFLLAYRKGVRPGAGARSWFLKTARYLALNERRRHSPFALDPADIEKLCDAAPPEADASGEDSFEEALTALRACLAELKERDRRLIAARYERRVPLEQISVEESQSLGYLKQRLFRLRLRLRACVRRRLRHDRTEERL